MGLLTKDASGYANTEASRSIPVFGFGSLHWVHHPASPSPDGIMGQAAGGDYERKTDPPARPGERHGAAAGIPDGNVQPGHAIGTHGWCPLLIFPECHTLLDLGGGPGTYAIHFCRQYPGLTATVMDLPTTRPFAENTIRKLGMEDRVCFVPGDFLQDDIPGRYDAVWMSHILHGESASGCRRIIDKAASCLNPGARIAVVHEFILDDTRDKPLFPALFSLNMLLATEGGRAYSQSQISGMLETAGTGGCSAVGF
jgi:hypothetical protein